MAALPGYTSEEMAAMATKRAQALAGANVANGAAQGLGATAQVPDVSARLEYLKDAVNLLEDVLDRLYTAVGSVLVPTAVEIMEETVATPRQIATCGSEVNERLRLATEQIGRLTNFVQHITGRVDIIQF